MSTTESKSKRVSLSLSEQFANLDDVLELTTGKKVQRIKTVQDFPKMYRILEMTDEMFDDMFADKTTLYDDPIPAETPNITTLLPFTQDTIDLPKPGLADNQTALRNELFFDLQPNELLPEDIEVEVSDDLLFAPLEAREFAVDALLVDNAYSSDACETYIKEVPMFIPKGAKFSETRKALQELGKKDTTKKEMFDANYYGCIQHGIEVQDALLIANIRAYAYDIGLRFNKEPTLSSRYTCMDTKMINIAERQSMFHMYRKSPDHAKLFGKSYKWLQLFTLFFMLDSPSYALTREDELSELYFEIFDKQPEDVYQCLLILFSGLQPFNIRDIHRVSHFCRKKYDSGSKIDLLFQNKFAKVMYLSYEDIPGMQNKDEYKPRQPFEYVRDTLYDDGQVKLILLHDKYDPTDDQYLQSDDDALSYFPESNNVKQNFKKRRHLPKFYQYQRPRMEVFYNSAHYGHYDYLDKRMHVSPNFKSVSAHLRNLESNKLHFYDPVYNETEDLYLNTH